jgi:hypothetical protein
MSTLLQQRRLLRERDWEKRGSKDAERWRQHRYCGEWVTLADAYQMEMLRDRDPQIVRMRIARKILDAQERLIDAGVRLVEEVRERGSDPPPGFAYLAAAVNDLAEAEDEQHRDFDLRTHPTVNNLESIGG